MRDRLIETDARSYLPLPLRVALGAVFIFHGAQKMFGWWEGSGLEGVRQFVGGSLGLQPDMLWAWLVAGGELFGGLLVLLGLATRLGALSIAVTMLVAIFAVHCCHFSAQHNGFEYPFTLLMAAISLMISGGGKFSMDALLQKKA